MKLSLQSTHPDITNRIALHLPLSSRLRLAATCRSLQSRVTIFKRRKSRLENLPSAVLHRIARCVRSHADRLRLGAASWALRKWAIQNGLLTFHCYEIRLQGNRFVFRGEHGLQLGVLPCRNDNDLPIRATATSFTLETNFSRAHIDKSIRRLSAFRPPLRPSRISFEGVIVRNGQSDDPTAVRRLVQYLSDATKPLKELHCFAGHYEPLLLESDFLHRVQAHNIYLFASDIGPNGLDFAVEDSVEDVAQCQDYPCVLIWLIKWGKPTRSPPILLDSILRFVRQSHVSPTSSARFKYDLMLDGRDLNGSAAIRAFAKECGGQLTTHDDGAYVSLEFKASSDPMRHVILSTQPLDSKPPVIRISSYREPEAVGRSGAF